MNKIYKNSGVRYWKDSFIDLKPFDEMNLGEVLTRYKNILEGFKEYQPDNGAFFVPIKRTSDLNIPEVKRIHEKFNSKTCIVDDNKKAKKFLKWLPRWDLNKSLNNVIEWNDLFNKNRKVIIPTKAIAMAKPIVLNVK